MRVIITLFLVLAGVVWAADEAPDSAADDDTAADSTGLSQQEIDAEMERINRALDETENPEEYVPSKPLAADLPVDLPSDL
jgi:hypothetical protein